MKAQLGIIGLGRIGADLARLGLRRKLRLADYTRGRAPRIGRGFTVAPDVPTLCSLLEKPRRVILWVPAGKAVDELIDALTAVMECGDVIADGDNSYWGDLDRRTVGVYGPIRNSSEVWQ